MQLAPLICVHDVESSSRWYQRLLGCQSGHGGAEYERLNSGNRLILQLHRWDTTHEHGALGDVGDRPYGNGCCSGSSSMTSTGQRRARST